MVMRQAGAAFGGLEDIIESFHEHVFCKPFTDRAVEQIKNFSFQKQLRFWEL
jgi:hypothetical protein